MKNNKLVLYKESIFTKIFNFFKNLFFKKNNALEINNESFSYNYNNKEKEEFIEDIQIKEDREEKRLRELQKLYDNGYIDEDDISDEDIDKLIVMYEKETEELNKDTEIRKMNISRMLKDLKVS